MKSKILRRICSTLLCCILSLNLVLSGMEVHAQEFITYNTDSVNADIGTDVAYSGLEDMKFEANNSLGNLFEAELNEVMENQEQSTGYNVFSVDMSDNIAIVNFETQEDCMLIVGIYSESDNKLLCSGMEEVSVNDSEIFVEIDTDIMPDYYYVRANMVAYETLQPLCEEYESPMYTREMQEFLSKTTDDFDSNRVLNFDSDNTNNFAVYSEDTIIIPESENSNIVSKVDETNNTYVIENADDYIKSLVKDDIFAYEYNDGENKVLLVKVDTITIDGDKVTIIGVDTSMEEVFDYVKIDEYASGSDMEVDTECQEGVRYNGLVEMASEEAQTYGAGIDSSYNIAASYEFLDVPLLGEKDDDVNVKLSGSVNFSIGVTVKIYVTLSQQYFEFRIDLGLSGNISVTGKISLVKVPLSMIKVSPVPGLYLTCTPSFVVSVDAKLTFSADMKGTIGGSISEKGFKNLCSKPKMKTEVSLEGKVFFGLSLEPEVVIFSKKFADASVDVTIGLEIVGEMKGHELTEEDEDERHSCSVCIEGAVYGVTEETIKLSLLDIEKFKIQRKFRLDTLITDYYVSFDYNESGFGTCPHKEYKTTILVQDKLENPLSDVSIGDLKTDAEGKVVIYLTNGKHNLNISKTGYKSLEYILNIKKKAKSIVVTLVDDSQSPEGGEVEEDNPIDSVVIDENNFPDENFRQYVLDNIDKNKNGYLDEEEILNVTRISCEEEGISDLTGISLFSELSILNCWNNNLSTLDLSKNVNLEELWCNGNNLSTLDLSKNVNLEYLYCPSNNLSILDVSQNANLGSLDCGNNNLSTLDLSKNVNLGSLDCGNNNLSTLDLSKNMNLGSLDCGNNNLSTLDLSKNVNLTKLNCQNNNLSILDLSKNVNLTDLNCQNNNLSTLDISQNVNLTEVFCYSNNLSTLNVSNIINLDLLSCGMNYLRTLDVSTNVNLTMLFCGSNNLSTLDVSKNVNLKHLYCSFNNLSSIDVSKNVNLHYLNCRVNNIRNLDLSMNINLEELYCDDSVVVTYPVTNNSVILESKDANIDTFELNSEGDETNNLSCQIQPSDTSKIVQQISVADDTHIDYTGLYENEIYNLYVVKEAQEDIPFGNIFSDGNLLYIKQFTSDSNGNLSIDYTPAESVESAVEILVSNKRIPLNEVLSGQYNNFVYNGEEQYFNIDLYDGDILLQEGKDYELSGTFVVTEVGKYTVTVNGIGKYEGNVEIEYFVVEANSDPEPTPEEPTTEEPTPEEPTTEEPTPEEPTIEEPTTEEPTTEEPTTEEPTTEEPTTEEPTTEESIPEPEPTPEPEPAPKPDLPGEEFAENNGDVFTIDEDGDVRCFDSNGNPIIDSFKCDGTYTYYFQYDGTAMKDRLTYHPDGEHVIYFDENGHEVFSDFAHITKSIAGDDVDDYCFFNVYGHMYVDTLTYDKTGTKLYYINEYGLLQHTGWFQFSGHEFEAGLGFEGTPGGYGYANADGSLMTNCYTYAWNGNLVYIQGDGHVLNNKVAIKILQFYMECAS